MTSCQKYQEVVPLAHFIPCHLNRYSVWHMSSQAACLATAPKMCWNGNLPHLCAFAGFLTPLTIFASSLCLTELFYLEMK